MPPVTIEIQASRQLGFLLAGVYCLALAMLPTLQLPLFAGLAMCVVVLISWRMAHKFLLSDSIVKLHLCSPAHCEIETKVDGRETATVVEQTMLGEYLIVMILAGASRHHRLVMLPDSTDTDSLRRLRVWLRALA